MWCVQIGYNRREMADAIAEQVMRMPYMNPFSLTSAPSGAELAARLAQMAPGDLTARLFDDRRLDRGRYGPALCAFL
jgi:putrescine---pyruvate transaminase